MNNMDTAEAIELSKRVLHEKLSELRTMIRLEEVKGNKILIENFQTGIDKLVSAIEALERI